MPVKKGKRDRGSSSGGFHRKTVYANCCLGIQGLLTNRDLDAAGRIRVVSDQNLRMSCEPIQFGNPILNKSSKIASGEY
jgi:hypothetical protein